MNRILLLLLCLCTSFSLLAQQPRRVIAGGSLTEIIYALNGGASVVGVDQTTGYPPETLALPQVSNWQQLNVDGILSLHPSQLLTWQDAQPQTVLDQLRQAGVEVLLFQRTPSTPQQLFINIRRAAAILHQDAAGEALVTRIEAQLQAVQQRIAVHPSSPRVLFLLSVGGNGATVAGKETVADGMISLAGGHNLATHRQYRPYGGEAMIAANPQVIVVTSQSVASGVETLAAIPGIAQTAAWQQQRIIVIDQALVLGMGPRVADAVAALHAGFYPTP